MRRHAAAFASLVALVACASPTLPLPPPSAPSMSESTEAGKVHLASDRGVEPNAIVVVINTNPNMPRAKAVGGAIADDVGSWATEKKICSS